MRRDKPAIAAAVAILAGGFLMALTNPATSQPPEAKPSASDGEPVSAPPHAAKDKPAKSKLEKITFGSGCFWCTEAVFAELAGVTSAVSGYSGGFVPNPTYEQVCTGATGHAEVIQVTYDPALISVPELLEVFWMTHDPTTLDQQGPDVGPQYRSAVFYHTESQRREAEYYKEKLNKLGAFDAPVVTEITKFEKFYPAEDYHQQYFAQNSDKPYCKAIIRPKVAKFRKAFHDKLKGSEAAKQRAADAAQDPEKIDWKNVDWRARLTPEEFHVTREAGTERAFTGKYWNVFDDGEYRCSNCGLPLFESVTKFDAGCGWPSFDKAIAKDAVTEHADNSLGMRRVEVRCRRCAAHLGHVFDDGPTATGLRYCMNSASLKFIPADDAVKADDSAPQEKPKDPAK